LRASSSEYVGRFGSWIGSDVRSTSPDAALDAAVAKRATANVARKECRIMGSPSDEVREPADHIETSQGTLLALGPLTKGNEPPLDGFEAANETIRLVV
jgi:hypothetical protein